MESKEEKKQNPVPKFKLWDKVTISGTLTGFGDLIGEIREIEYSLQHNEFFYTVTTEVKSFWSSERFLVKAEIY